MDIKLLKVLSPAAQVCRSWSVNETMSTAENNSPSFPKDNNIANNKKQRIRT